MDTLPATDGPAAPSPTPEEAAHGRNVPTDANQAAQPEVEAVASPVIALSKLSHRSSQPGTFQLPSGPGALRDKRKATGLFGVNPRRSGDGSAICRGVIRGSGPRVRYRPSHSARSPRISPRSRAWNKVFSRILSPECDRDCDHEPGGQPPDRVDCPGRLGETNDRDTRSLLSRRELVHVSRGHDSDSDVLATSEPVQARAAGRLEE